MEVASCASIDIRSYLLFFPPGRWSHLRTLLPSVFLPSILASITASYRYVEIEVTSRVSTALFHLLDKELDIALITSATLGRASSPET